MMCDFLTDLCIRNEKHFAANDNDPYYFYGSMHYNTHMWVKGTEYIINAQPGFPWEYSPILTK